MRKPSEIGELATSFNDMARQLTASIEHVRETTAAKEPIERELKVAYDIQMSMGSGLCKLPRGPPWAWWTKRPIRPGK